MAARATRRFDAPFGGFLAEVAAINFVCTDRRANGAIAEIVAALDAEVAHYGQGEGATGLFEISRLRISAAGSCGV
jgi:hypothetical protein